MTMSILFTCQSFQTLFLATFFIEDSEAMVQNS